MSLGWLKFCSSISSVSLSITSLFLFLGTVFLGLGFSTISSSTVSVYSTFNTFLGVVLDLVLVLTLLSVLALFERKDRPKLVRVGFSLVSPTPTFT